HAYPYLVDKFYYGHTNQYTGLASSTGAPGVLDSTPTGQHDGWFGLLEMFEVPSSSLGAYGPVQNGNNLDWQRQDLKPGLLNINLIIEEEVFCGLIDDPRLNTDALVTGGPSFVPQVVSLLDSTGQPAAAGSNPGMPPGFYPMSNRGYNFWNLNPTPPITS